jgi:hypothetical protein
VDVVVVLHTCANPASGPSPASTSASINAASCPARTPRSCRLARLVSSITPAACRSEASAIALASSACNTPPGSLMRQIPPSSAATMRIQESTGLASRDGPSISQEGKCCGIGTPRPMMACTNNPAGRFSGLQVVVQAGHPGAGLRAAQWHSIRRGLAAYSCGGSHSDAVFPLRPRRAPATDTVLCLFSDSTTMLRPCLACRSGSIEDQV